MTSKGVATHKLRNSYLKKSRKGHLLSDEQYFIFCVLQNIKLLLVLAIGIVHRQEDIFLIDSVYSVLVEFSSCCVATTK